MDIDKIVSMLALDEGFRAKPYLCSESFPTVGYGQKLGPKCEPNELHHYYQFKIPEAVARKWLEHGVRQRAGVMVIDSQLRDVMSKLNEPRQAVLVGMAYQLGVNGLKSFKKALAAILEEKWDEVSYHMMDSKWEEQTPNRAKRYAEQMRTGEWLECYN